MLWLQALLPNVNSLTSAVLASVGKWFPTFARGFVRETLCKPKPPARLVGRGWPCWAAAFSASPAPASLGGLLYNEGGCWACLGFL